MSRISLPARERRYPWARPWPRLCASVVVVVTTTMNSGTRAPSIINIVVVGIIIIIIIVGDNNVVARLSAEGLILVLAFVYDSA